MQLLDFHKILLFCLQKTERQGHRQQATKAMNISAKCYSHKLQERVSLGDITIDGEII